jgi:hypothetical protein
MWYDMPQCQYDRPELKLMKWKETDAYESAHSFHPRLSR